MNDDKAMPERHTYSRFQVQSRRWGDMATAARMMTGKLAEDEGGKLRYGERILQRIGSDDAKEGPINNPCRKKRESPWHTNYRKATSTKE